MLVSLLHGKNIVSGTQSTLGAAHEITRSILERAKELNSRSIEWHHHMLFPDCALNPQRGKWTIMFEDPENSKTLCAVYDSEPISDLQQVESLFYAQVK